MWHTTFLSRLIGLWVLIVSIAELSHKATMVTIAADFSNTPALLFVSGVFTLLAGLAIVLSHNIWTGGATPVVVTLVGWVLLIKGALLLLISPNGWTSLLEASHFGEYAYFYGSIGLLLGLYLTYAGFWGDHSKPSGE